MTLTLLNNLGITTSFKDQLIWVGSAKKIKRINQVVESDWSSASYFFSIVALAKKAKISLTSFKKSSLQGDVVLLDIYEQLGVSSRFEEDTLYLKKENKPLPNSIQLDLTKTPDIAQTIAVSCYGLGVACNLTGLHTLKIKETDRLIALENELSKLGAQIRVTEESLHLSADQDFKANQTIATYSDHRMAMAFAPLALKISHQIAEANVVTKSYPDFWNDLEALGFELIEK